jgi:hypothetical protein
MASRNETTPMNPDYFLPRLAVSCLALLVGLSGCTKRGDKAGPKTDPGIIAKLEAIRQAGQPATPTELNAWYPEPTAGENAAPLYAEAFAALAATDAKSLSFVAKNQPALPLLHKAAAKTQCRYPVDLKEGGNAPLPHLAKTKISAQLLARDAAANAAKGRTDLAAQSAADGLRLARSLEQEPLMISHLVRIAAESIAVSGLETSLSVRAFPDEWLARLQSLLGEGERTLGSSLVRGFAGERCLALAWFQMTPQEYEQQGSGLGTNKPFGSPADFERYRQQSEFMADFNCCLDSFSNWVAVASQPLPAGLDAAGQWATTASATMSDAQARGLRLSPMILPALGSAMEKTVEATAQSRTAATALAVERYRLANGHALPGSLSQLVPHYFASVPEDPYDGKPLRYKKLSPKGYVVYSVGRNRQDDGGSVRPLGAKADGPYDVTFAVRR